MLGSLQKYFVEKHLKYFDKISTPKEPTDHSAASRFSRCRQKSAHDVNRRGLKVVPKITVALYVY